MLKDILGVLVQQYKTLMWAVVMGMVVTYLYAVIGWTLVVHDIAYGFDHFEFGPGTEFLDWVLAHWEAGLRDVPETKEDWTTTSQRGGMPWNFLILSFTYFIFVVQIMGAIISGIIIDAFGARREARLAMAEDKKDVDFVSGLHRSELEDMNLDFDGMRDEHHDWRNYLYFCVYLDEKDEDDYTGVETYTANLLAAQPNPDPGFFPLGRCGVLDAALSEKHDQKGTKEMEDLEDAVAGTGGGGKDGTLLQFGTTTRMQDMDGSAYLSKQAKEWQVKVDTKIDELLTLNRDIALEGSGSFDFESIWNMVDIDDVGALDADGVTQWCSTFVAEVYKQQQETIEDVENGSGRRDMFLLRNILAIVFDQPLSLLKASRRQRVELLTTMRDHIFAIFASGEATIRKDEFVRNQNIIIFEMFDVLARVGREDTYLEERVEGARVRAHARVQRPRAISAPAVRKNTARLDALHKTFSAFFRSGTPSDSGLRCLSELHNWILGYSVMWQSHTIIIENVAPLK